ncbi:hypothetical protein [Desulfonatronovibrio magnus]|uniref:hypothetical protein n=1 Tax=Desulfonatronovibrio magnus TaxID=698827 RepID=UPI0005EACEC2|nr:hypothetical protein [Desulfonatronovibrio magnus]
MRKITLKDIVLDRTITFKGELLGESNCLGEVYKNHDTEGYIVRDPSGVCEEYAPGELYFTLDQFHPKHACPDVGGPTKNELLSSLVGRYLLMSDAAKVDPFIGALLDLTVYRDVVFDYLNNEAGV